MKAFFGLILLCLALVCPLFAGEDPPEFRPYMLDHPFAGCPENSQCERSTGQLFNDWSELSSKNEPKKLNDFRQKKGMPIKLWAQADFSSVSSNQVLPAIALWDSACPKLKQQKISEGVFFAADFRALKQQSHPQIKLFSHHILMMPNQASSASSTRPVNILDYQIPRDEGPTAIKQQALYFTIEENGHYLGLWVEASGALKLAPAQKIQQLPERVPCPSPLIQHYQTGLEKSHFYDGYYCLELKEQDTNKSYTLLIGHTCN